jgi:hypothetical protein
LDSAVSRPRTQTNHSANISWHTPARNLRAALQRAAASIQRPDQTTPQPDPPSQEELQRQPVPGVLYPRAVFWGSPELEYYRTRGADYWSTLRPTGNVRKETVEKTIETPSGEQIIRRVVRTTTIQIEVEGEDLARFWKVSTEVTETSETVTITDGGIHVSVPNH